MIEPHPIHRSEHPASYQEETARGILNRALEISKLEPVDLQRIADFGAGFGDSVQAILTVAPAAQIIALESSPQRASLLRNRSILPPEQVMQTDGIEYLLDERQKDMFTLVTAFGLGPDKSGRLFQQLANACSQALSQQGKLLVTSDSYTMGGVRDLLAKKHMQYSDFLMNTHQVYILSKEACQSI